ncbi:MAG: metallophosphoesterase [Parcubacteria group bacterium]|jgi:predicted phosphodiesterase
MQLFKKKWVLAILLMIALVGILFIATKKFSKQQIMEGGTRIGWVSDIHADRFKKRDVDSGLLYPKKYMEYLPKVFDAMKDEGINVVIATGDNTNSGDDNYARELKRIAEEKKMDVIWVRGNHDNDEVMEILGVSGEDYYFRDYKGTRIIIMDTTEYLNGEYDYKGGVSSDQLAWLREAMQTDKEIIVAMHIPIFDSDTEKYNIHDLEGEFLGVSENVLERFSELEKVLRESGKVKIVLNGHWHVRWQKEYNGVRYFGQSALTREKSGMGAYATINLDNKQVDYKFAR